MENMVTMSLKDYDELRETINNQKKEKKALRSKYPLKIVRVVEFEGVNTTGYYSKGHHDKNEFIEAVRCDYECEGNIDDVRHIYIKVSPSQTGGVLINHRNEPCRGSFPATVIEV